MLTGIMLTVIMLSVVMLNVVAPRPAHEIMFASLFPGFGDAIDNSKCWDPVINFVESRYEEFLDAETRCQRHKAFSASDGEAEIS